MKKYFVLTALLFTTLCHAECEVTQANSEAECSSIIEGVNTITGSYSFTVPIHHVPGAQPLTFYRSFNSHDYLFDRHPYWSQSFYGALELEKTEINNQRHYRAFYVEDGGASTFLIQPRRKGHLNLSLKLSHDYSLTRGVTNTSRGVISATTNISNMKIELEGWKDTDPIVTKSDGTIQHFHKIGKAWDRYHYTLMESTFPNGNRYSVNYRKDKNLNYKYSGMTFTNADESLVLLDQTNKYVCFSKRDKVHVSSISFNDGNKVFQNHIEYDGYFMEEKKPFYYLSAISPTNAPDEFYTYKEYGKYARLSKRSKKEKRYVQVEYYNTTEDSFSNNYYRLGRVKALKAPASTNADPITIYTFDYYVHQDGNDYKVLYEGDTLVTDGNGNCKRYIYDKHHRLTDINHMGKNTIYLPYRQNIFSWSHDGKLQYTHFNDHIGHCIHYKRFEYDERGNVLKEEVYGSFSKEWKSFPLTDGLPTDPDLECKTTTNTYANNRFNHLLTSDTAELLTKYSYLAETNLPASKIVTDNKNISMRTFYTYDRNKALIEEISDNGTSEDKNDLTNVTQRIIKRITPRTKGTGIGLPLIEEVYGYDVHTGTEKLISKTANTYNAQYKLIKQDIYDSNKQFVYCKQWVYDEKGNLTQEMDALGNVSTYSYDANYNCIHQLSNSGQKEFFYTYDFMNRLIKKELKDPQGNSYTTSYRYDVMGNPIGEIDHYGNETEFVYDAHNRCIEIKRPMVASLDGKIEKPILYKEYDECDNLTCEIDAQGGITRSQYNSFGKPVALTHADGSQEFMRYDLYNRLVEKTERNGSKKVYEYDALGRVLEERILDRDGSVLCIKSNVYDAFNLISSTDTMGLTTTYTYDYAGRLLSQKTGEKCLSKSYDALGHLASETLHHGEMTKVSRFFYDFKNQLLETVIEDVMGNPLERTSIEYDQEGRKNLVRQHREEGSYSTRIEYDVLDRTVEVVLPNGISFYAFYEDRFVNVAGQTVARKCLLSPNGHQVFTTFDTWGRAVCTEEYRLDSLLHKKEQNYDLNDHCLWERFLVTTPGKASRTVINAFTYDTLGNLVEQIEGLSDPKQRITSYTYDLNGQKASYTKSDGIKIYYEYDALGRLLREFSSDDSVGIYWEYNLKNQPTRITDKQSTTLRSYDLYGRLVQEKLGNDLTLNYAYDLFDRLLSIQYPDGTQSRYEYNSLALTQVSYKDQIVKYQYDSFGHLQSTQLANGDVIHYAYDELNRLLSAESKLWSQNQLTYDVIGNLTSFQINGELSRFSYDAYNQIAAEEGLLQHVYEHDSLCNRTKKDEQEFDFNALNQMLSSDSEYDANGNLIRYKETFYFYDAHDRLLKVKNPNLTENYTYDPFHRRLTNGAIRYAYQDTNEIAAFDAQNVCLEKRILGLGRGAEVGSAVLIELDGHMYSPYHDHRGNVCAIAQENIIESYQYSAFSQESNQSSRNPWRFASKRQDQTGLVYFGYRYYMPELGRWLTADPIGFKDGPNRYAYCVNNPVGKIDLYGLNSYDFSWCQRDYGMPEMAWRQSYEQDHKNWVTSYHVAAFQLHHARALLIENLGHHFSPLSEDYKVIARIGRGFQGKGFDSYSDGYLPTHSIPYGSKMAEDGSYNMFCNGIMTYYESACNKVDLVKQCFGESMGEVFFTSTHGLANDLLSAVTDFAGCNTEAALKLTERIEYLFNVVGIKELNLYGESRGGAIVGNALSRLPNDIKSKINVVTQGSASIFPNKGYKSLQHYVDVWDPVPYVLQGPVMGLLACQGSQWVTFQSNPDTWIHSAHDFFDPKSTYVKNYVDFGKKYQEKLKK